MLIILVLKSTIVIEFLNHDRKLIPNANTAAVEYVEEKQDLRCFFSIQTLKRNGINYLFSKFQRFLCQMQWCTLGDGIGNNPPPRLQKKIF